MEVNNFDINKLINIFIKKNVGKYNLQDNDLIKFRYEYKYRNIDKNIFIYLKDWSQIISLYKLIPNKEKHFYEIIDEKCKFFLDLDAKVDNINKIKWDETIIFIKKKLKIFFRNLFNKDIDIIEYQSIPTFKEKKFSCHLVVPKYIFYAEDCKNVCCLFLSTLGDEYKNIIDSRVYGRRRMLRMEGSTKINSDRIKICLNKDSDEIINLKGLITNLENTELIFTPLYNINNSNNKLNLNNEEIKKVVLKQEYRKYYYTNNDVDFVKKNYKKIELIINRWHYDIFNLKSFNTIFTIKKIIDNMIIFKRLIPFNCPDCRRTHEKEHPYIFIKYKKLFFHCRRSSKPIEISYLLEDL